MKRYDVAVDGLHVHLAEAGDGPPLVLLHGLGVTHETWEPTIEALAVRWRVIAPDLPGHGRSSKPDAPYTIDFFAGVVRSLGRALGVNEAVVIGNSMGGRIALELAIAYPRFTRALVLAAPAGDFAPVGRLIAALMEVTVRPAVLRVALPWAIAWALHDADAALRARLAAAPAREDFPHHARAVRRALAGVLSVESPDLARVTQPVQLVWGERDRLVPLAFARALRRGLPHARLALLPCGHFPMLERPAEFHRLTTDFLQAVEAAPPAGRRGAA
ncbi:MAG TPA: alpha/beta fold hydrolase [Candidatus Binatia bacterium]|nr:alpha/beta fold hydrolase [Candidatus Binatia bacterium]